MSKIMLNNYKMNEAIAILKEATQKAERSHFAVQCDNCTISIVTENPFGNNKETVEVALRTIDDSDWIPLFFENRASREELECLDIDTLNYICTEERPIIHALPLIAFPAFIRQFQSLTSGDFAEVWDAWDTISVYM